VFCTLGDDLYNGKTQVSKVKFFVMFYDYLLDKLEVLDNHNNNNNNKMAAAAAAESGLLETLYANKLEHLLVFLMKVIIQVMSDEKFPDGAEEATLDVDWVEVQKFVNSKNVKKAKAEDFVLKMVAKHIQKKRERIQAKASKKRSSNRQNQAPPAVRKRAKRNA
jgi:hypothetical protein